MEDLARLRRRIISTKVYLILGEHPPRDGDVPDWWWTSPDPFLATANLDAFIRGLDYLRETLEGMRDETELEALRTVTYDAAKIAFGDDKGAIRTFFQYMYAVVFGLPQGPAWGLFIQTMGVPEFLDLLEARCTSLTYG